MKKFLAFMTVACIMCGCVDELVSTDDDEEIKGPDDEEQIDPEPEETWPLTGKVQKGPFALGGGVTAYLLDENLSQTGISYTAKISAADGSYTFEKEIESRFVEVSATGYWFNESKGELSASTITLNAIADLSESGTVNINVLTTLASDMIRNAVKDGRDYAEAKADSETATLAVFHITENHPDFQSIDLTQEGTGAAILLSASSTLITGRQESEVVSLMATIAAELASSGEVSESTASKISEGASEVDAEAVRANLLSYYAQEGLADAVVPEFEGWLDTNGNGILDKDESWLILGEKELWISDEGGELQVELQYNVDCEVVIDDEAASWITVSPAARGFLKTSIINLTVAPNEEYDERVGTVTVREIDGTQEEKLIVVQKQKDAVTVTSDSYEVEPEGGVIDIEVKANVQFDYHISDDSSDWIRPAPQTKGLESTHLQFTVDRSYEPELRTGEIIFTSGDLTETVTVYQAGEKTLILNQDEYMVSDEGGTIEVLVSSNCEDLAWRFTGDVDWISELRTRSYDLHRLSFAVMPNHTYGAREARIEIYDRSGGVSETVTVYQVQNDALMLAKDSYTFDNSGGRFSVEVQHNVPVEVEIPDSCSWISRIQTKALQTSVMDFAVAANEAYDSRSGIVIFHGSDLSDTVKVYQAQENAIILSGPDHTLYHGGEIFSVDVKSNVDYSVSVSASWLHYIRTKGLVSSTARFSADRNTGTGQRSATITFRNNDSGIEERLTVAQEGKPMLYVEEKEYEVPYTGGILRIPVTTNTDFDIELFPAGISSWLSYSIEKKADNKVEVVLDIEPNETGYRGSGDIIISSKETGDSFTVTIVRGREEHCLELVYAVTSTTEATMLYDQTVSQRPFNNQVASDFEISRVIYDDEEVIGNNIYPGYTFKRTGSIPVTVYYYGTLKTISGFNSSYEYKGYAPIESLTAPETCTRISNLNNIPTLKSITVLNDEYVYVGASNCPNFKTIYGPMATEDHRALISPEGDLLCYASGGLTHITIPEGVRKINDSMFEGALSIRSVSFPESLEIIGSSAFEETGIEEVSLSSKLKSIEGHAFYKCTNLSRVSMLSCTELGSQVFCKCSWLESVKLPEGITEIKYAAFGDCERLREVNIPSTVKTIDRYAFDNCKALPSINLPEGLTSIAGTSFNGCKSLTSVSFPSTLQTISGFSATGLSEVTIPATVITIDEGAFSGCTSLSKVTFEPGSQLKVIKDGAFASSSIETITFPASLEVLWGRSFELCSNLREVRFESGSRLKSIADGYKSSTYYGAFANCSKLSVLELPEGLEYIGIGAFYYCTALTELKIPESVKTISNGAFASCKGLTSVRIPDAVNVLGADAFYNCTGLETVDIGSGVTSLSPSAFFRCSGLSSITSTSMKYEATSDNRCLVDYEGRLLNFAWKGASASYDIPSSTASFTVKHIAPEVFNSCEGITAFTIPETVEGIGQLAFYSPDIEIVYCKCKVPPTLNWSDNVTESSIGGWIVGNSHLPFRCPVYVPSASLELYQADSKWAKLNISGYDF